MSWREFLKKDITPKPFRKEKPARWRKIFRFDLTPPFMRRPRKPGLLAILSQLEAIVQTNSPLPDGLAACALDAPSRRVARAFRKLSVRLESGDTLGESMDALPGIIPRKWVDLIHAGERTGQLDVALNSLAEETSHRIERGYVVRNRVAYFVLVLLAQFLIISFIAIKILPVFAEVIEEFGELPPRSATIILQSIQFLEQYSWALLWSFAAFMLATLLLPFLHRRIWWVQSLVTYFLLPLPGLGRLHRNKNLERIAGVLQILLAGGVPLPEALGAAAKIHISRPFQKVMARAQRAVEGGHPLSEALARHGYLMGETLVTMVKLGEYSGGLDESCGHARELYRRAIMRTQSTLADLLVPSGVFVCGSVTLLICLATFGSFIAIGDAIVMAM